MTFGLRCYQPASRPHPASLPVRVPAVESLLPASFSFTSRLRLAVHYGYRHRSRLAPFIQLDHAHAGHTEAREPKFLYRTATYLVNSMAVPKAKRVLSHVRQPSDLLNSARANVTPFPARAAIYSQRKVLVEPILGRSKRQRDGCRFACAATSKAFVFAYRTPCSALPPNRPSFDFLSSPETLDSSCFHTLLRPAPFEVAGAHQEQANVQVGP